MNPMLATLALSLFLPVVEEEEEKPKWSVDDAPGPKRDVTIDVDEGTWMSVDLSPDGKTVVFDLLGDLYTVPIEGGEATAVTSGVAWDMHPRFSPDGARIAFTSDRGGGDNLWVVNVDGSEPKAVTKETFRLVCQPAWSPDGRYLVGRKHFTTRRSLGSGELWLYAVDGEAGSGLRMTERPTPQKDVGEPVFSPDGRHVWFSLDATGGETFEYSKDSTDGIYQIRRLDRETGEIETIVSGPGGACRPTPSPDGERLAFVRRTRFHTALFVMDLASGAARMVTDDLERDMQETWAIHGVYPSMAWTPDGEEIVLYAKGRLRRVDVASGASRVIPFRVKGTRSIQEPVRFPVAVAPETFEVKVCRWPEVAPDGSRVVYQALGHLYVKALPDGAPRRLTTQDDHFEFHPSWSRDGEWIVYTTWNDEDLGSVRAVRADGSGLRVLTPAPGQFVEPCFSPDGTAVVYRKVAGGYVTSPLWGRESGIYRVAFADAPDERDPVRIAKRGVNPQFGASGERVFLEVAHGGAERDDRRLVSVPLAGPLEFDEREHLASQWATEYAVSPDGRWVAFVERFHAYVTPLVDAGRTVDVGPGGGSVPQAKITHDAGESLHWSGDATTVHWSLGPTLYSRKLTDCFAFLDGAPEELPAPPTDGVAIGFSHPHAAPEGAVALVGARLVTMRGDEVIDDGTVVVRGNRIVAVGPRAEVPVPADAEAVDARGKTIVPGFVDVHAHGAQASEGITPQRNWIDHANLAFGVTTIHDPSNDTNEIHAASELAKAGLVLSPRTFSTGTILYGAAGSFKAEIESLEDALFHLRRMKAIGAISVKSYNQPRRDQRQQVIEAARQVGIMVVPEGGSTFMHNLTMVVDGHTGVEHSLPVERIYADVTQLWGPTPVGYTPTLVVGYGGIWGENYWYDRTDVWKDERLMTFVPRFVVDPRARRRTKAPDEDYNHLRSAGICKAIVDAGGRTQIGAHGQLAGLAAHWELWMLGQGGLTNHEALRAATLDGAFYVGLDGDIGSLEEGKLADLLVLDANPLDDLRSSTSIRFTMLNGVLYDARTMREAGSDEGPIEFFWTGMQDGLPAQEAGAHAHCHGCEGG
ncbi:MAG: amidohydrolase family protein [Planctomycetota bacterium JB042]